MTKMTKIASKGGGGSCSCSHEQLFFTLGLGCYAMNVTEQINDPLSLSLFFVKTRRKEVSQRREQQLES